MRIVQFADMMLLTESKKDMANNLSEVTKVMTKLGMKIHWGKTKVMLSTIAKEKNTKCVWMWRY